MTIMAPKPKWVTVRIRVAVHRQIRKLANTEGRRVEYVVEHLLTQALKSPGISEAGK
jgi:hypothetical protein